MEAAEQIHAYTSVGHVSAVRLYKARTEPILCQALVLPAAEKFVKVLVHIDIILPTYLKSLKKAAGTRRKILEGHDFAPGWPATEGQKTEEAETYPRVST